LSDRPLYFVAYDLGVASFTLKSLGHDSGGCGISWAGASMAGVAAAHLEAQEGCDEARIRTGDASTGLAPTGGEGRVEGAQGQQTDSNEWRAERGKHVNKEPSLATKENTHLWEGGSEKRIKLWELSPTFKTECPPPEGEGLLKKQEVILTTGRLR
jgi:hypothetical protein